MNTEEIMQKLPMIADHGGNDCRMMMFTQQWIKGEAGWAPPEKVTTLAMVAGEGDIFFETVASKKELGETTFKVTFYASMAGWDNIVSYLESESKTKGH